MAKDGMSESARKELNESRRRIEDLQAQLSKVNGQVILANSPVSKFTQTSNLTKLDQQCNLSKLIL